MAFSDYNNYHNYLATYPFSQWIHTGSNRLKAGIMDGTPFIFLHDIITQYKTFNDFDINELYQILFSTANYDFLILEI